MDRATPDGFAGNDRFALIRAIGRGGMGVVYEVHDQLRDARVALKTARSPDADALYRFKQEFRALAGVTHANLVPLYELISMDEGWFFTMELVDGVDLMTWLRGERTDAGQTTATTGPIGSAGSAGTRPLTMPLTGVRASPVAAAGGGPTVRPQADLARLRDALAQLAQGVHALHGSGHLHRDIKPSNVLVNRDGRVVLLDFGIIAELAGARWRSGEVEGFGTPDYVAPERIARDPIGTEASDWYSVGVVLFEALTGQRPFVGPPHVVLEVKQMTEPAPPHIYRPGIPDDLDQLCVDLLRRDPRARPAGAEVLARLGAMPGAAVGTSAAHDPVFVGRDRELTFLRTALADARRGDGCTVHLHGPTGVGKSALTHQFLGEVAREPEAVILAGRCYECESVPYKAIDSLVDALCRHLLGLSAEERARLLPEDFALAAQVFPVLRRLTGSGGDAGKPATASALELRRRTFRAIRTVLATLAAERPLVVLIDDLQWGDADSVALLGELTHPAAHTPLLLLLSYRTEGAGTPLIQAMVRREARLGPSSRARVLEIQPLPDGDALALASALLGDGEGARAAAIARDAGGNPFFVHELAHHARDPGRQGMQGAGLQQLVTARIERLPAPGRRLLEVVAVAGMPISHAVARDAGRLTAAEAQGALHMLRSAYLVRSSGVGDDDRIETYHDRIRETLVDHLRADRRRACHIELAEALLAHAPAEAEAIALHFRAGGDHARAARHAEIAGDHALAAFAFDRAATLYQEALAASDHGQPPPVLHEKLGQALASAGRGAEAARCYLDAAGAATTRLRAVELTLEAVYELLHGGHIDTGLEVLERVLDGAGLRLAASPRRALISLLHRRARLRLRLRRPPRVAAERAIAAEDLARIDAGFHVGVTLSMVDSLRGMDLASRSALMSLAAADPYRVARAIASDVVVVAATSMPAGEARAWRMLRDSEALAAEVRRPYLDGLIQVGTTMLHYQMVRFTKARAHGERAIEILRRAAAGADYWLRNTVEHYWLWSLHYLGDVRALVAATRELVRNAEERNDLYTIAGLRTGLPSLAGLAAGEAQECRRGAIEAVERWSTRGYHLQHYWQLFALVQCDLYDGDGRAAYQRALAGWPALRRSLLLRMPLVRIEAEHLLARAALAAAAAGDAAGADHAARIARSLRRLPLAIGSPLAALIEAGLLHLRGDPAAAAVRCEAAAGELDRLDMKLFAAAARLRAATGDDQWMRSQGVRDPDRLSHVLVAGFAR
jgi:hypothetical protein